MQMRDQALGNLPPLCVLLCDVRFFFFFAGFGLLKPRRSLREKEEDSPNARFLRRSEAVCFGMIRAPGLGSGLTLTQKERM